MDNLENVVKIEREDVKVDYFSPFPKCVDNLIYKDEYVLVRNVPHGKQLDDVKEKIRSREDKDSFIIGVPGFHEGSLLNIVESPNYYSIWYKCKVPEFVWV